MNETQRDALEKCCELYQAEVVSTISRSQEMPKATLVVYFKDSVLLLDAEFVRTKVRGILGEYWYVTSELFIPTTQRPRAPDCLSSLLELRSP